MRYENPRLKGYLRELSKYPKADGEFAIMDVEPKGMAYQFGAPRKESDLMLPVNEVEGIGPGTVSKYGQTITHTVTNAVNVPEGTKIRLEFVNTNNPLNPSANYKVTVTTRDAANVIIDGPSQSKAYTIKQIGVNAKANNHITTPKIADSAITTEKVASSFAYERILADGESGWNPDGTAINFGITDSLFDVAQDIVVVNLDGDSTAPIATCAVSNLAFEVLTVTCTTAPPDGAQLRYTVFSPAEP
jgi:hypothetical protein